MFCVFPGHKNMTLLPVHKVCYPMMEGNVCSRRTDMNKTLTGRNRAGSGECIA
jgi:hypothetical protein